MASKHDLAHSKSGSEHTAPPRSLRFGRLLLACLAAIAFCGWLVWFALTYLPDCCGPG